LADRNPLPTADVLIEVGDRIVLVRRMHPPPGWAIPGGFVEVGETVEAAAVREALEETGLRVTLSALLGVYSDPARDPRHHTISTVYVGRAEGSPLGGDDAAEARLFSEADLPSPLAFDHAMILSDYFLFKRTGKRPL
jgi:8-oxo-dGTP diphosphatase